MPATSWRLNTYSNYKSQHHRLQGSSTLQHVSEFPSFLRLSDISSYVYTTLCLFIPEILLWMHLFSSYIFVWASCMGKMSEVIHFPLELIPAYWLIQNLFIWGINKVNVDFLLMYFSLCISLLLSNCPSFQEKNVLWSFLFPHLIKTGFFGASLAVEQKLGSLGLSSK